MKHDKKMLSNEALDSVYGIRFILNHNQRETPLFKLNF